MVNLIKVKIIASDGEVAIAFVDYISRYSSKHKKYPNRLLLSRGSDTELIISRDPVTDSEFGSIVSLVYNDDKIDLTTVGPFVSEWYFGDNKDENWISKSIYKV